ncbi:MAG: 16S rRNA (guanine(966)-N(2))-methyltransferase RsmD [Hyphomonadaceae bacterium]|jgi:16S rRNA (guanine966-N2)-methyltransferase|nr:16S rRNA (guanine(966)-N(2))-methyltransferase RsmD [Hyphomonadaceae bacterium]
MRIIAGQWRGKVLVAPPGSTTRPTAERARQALFNRIEHADWSPGLQGAVVLDLFAGTGALGLEALSRGATHATFVERNPAALKALRANIAACRCADRVHVVAGDASRPAYAGPLLTLLFADPPYRTGAAVLALASLPDAALAPDAVAIIETAHDEAVAPPSGWRLVDVRSYGAARTTVLARA